MEAGAARERLQEEKRRRERSAQALAEEFQPGESERFSTGELSTLDQHPADLGTETFEREKDTALLATLEREISEIDAALERIEAGTYGKCERCGGDIGSERLEAVPVTRFCVEHARGGLDG